MAVASTDVHNEQLVDQVDPPETPDRAPKGRYNLVVVGSGTVARAIAAGAAALGAKVALVEEHPPSGDAPPHRDACQALIRAGRAAADVARAGQFGVCVPPGTQVDFAAVIQRARQPRISGSAADARRRVAELGVDLLAGPAAFAGPGSLHAGDRVLRFRKAAIARGSRPQVLPIPGLAELGYLTDETVVGLEELPPRLAIVGGGASGCELAQAFARCGAAVDLVETAPRVLDREDPDASRVIAQALADDGVRLHTNAQIVRASRQGTSKMLALKKFDGQQWLSVDEILVAAPRVPDVEGLQLAAAGVEFDPRVGIRVNDHLQTANRHIFAVNDAGGPANFAQAAEALAHVVVQNALLLGRARASALAIPWGTRTDPEVAHVGLYPREARRLGMETDTLDVPIADPGDLAGGAATGFLKIHVRHGSDRIVGATVVAACAREMIGELSLAMTARVGLRRIAETIHVSPSPAQAIKQAADQYRRTRLAPPAQKLIHKWLEWTR